MARVLMVVAAVAAAAVTALVVWPAGDDDNNSIAAASRQWTPVSGEPFKEPAQLERPEGDGPQDIKVDLSARTDQTVVAGSPIWARTYNGGLVGPTIHARPGDTIKVTFKNGLGGGHPTNIHYHGLHVSPLDDADNIFRTFDDGKTYESTVELLEDQPTGTYWYHAHFHGISDGQVMGGLSGLLIIDGLKSLLPADLKNVDERQITLRDVQLGLDGESRATSIEGDYIAGNRDIDAAPASTFRLVNGLYQPKFSMTSSKYELWRLANIGSDVFYKLEFVNKVDAEKKQKFAILAEDGVPVWEVTSPSVLLLPPGKRFDVLVLAGDEGTYELQSVPYAQRANTALKPKPIPCNPDGVNCEPVTLATVDVTGSGAPVPALPTKLADKDDDLSNADVDARHEFVFDYKPDPPFEAWIDGKAFAHGEMPVVSPVMGDVEEWTLVNKTRDDHPFHIHINGFQVMKVDGEDYEAHGHQDVVNIPKQRKVDGQTVNGTVVIRHKFKTFHGWFVFHCHILNHEDAGMMRTIQVLEHKGDPVTPPPDDHARVTAHHATP